jgi:glycosyltransferase involved in cell wall biosynthesis
MTDVAWLGAVHGARRTAFYESIDLLVFPTVYVHESEPLVILEALAHGVPVVTTRRGCIASALADGAAVQALEEARFVDAAAAVIHAVCRDASSAERKRTVAKHYERLCAIGRAQWGVLAARIEHSGRPAG